MLVVFASCLQYARVASKINKYKEQKRSEIKRQLSDFLKLKIIYYLHEKTRVSLGINFKLNKSYLKCELFQEII